MFINIGVNSSNPQPHKRLLKRQAETYRRKKRKWKANNKLKISDLPTEACFLP